MMRAGITILLILSVTILSKAQNASTCLSEAQLLSLQTLSYDGVNDFMNNLGWSRLDDSENQTVRFFGFYLDYSIAKWQNKKTNFIEGVFCLYYKTGKPNLMVYHNPDNVCFNNLLTKQSSLDLIKKTSNNLFKSSSYKKPGGTIMDFREHENDISSLRFSLIVYNEASVNRQILEMKAEVARIKANEAGRKKAVKIATQAGDSLFNSYKYDDAIKQYSIAEVYLKTEEKSLLTEIESKLKVSRETKNRIYVENKIKEGDNYLLEKNYNNALISYLYAQSYYRANPTNFDPLLNIEAKLTDAVLRSRESVTALVLQGSYQSYKASNPSGFNAFRSENLDKINSMISELKWYGNVRYKAVIKFDSQGKNNSYIKIDTSSGKEVNNYINRISVSNLTPVRKLEFYIPTLEELPFDVSWDTYLLRATWRASKTQIKPAGKLASDFSDDIGKFINQQDYKHGIYKFEVVEKKLNGNTFSDLSLIKYNSDNGPLSAAYSLVLPGWGTSKVTDGQKGKIRGMVFLLSAVVCAGTKIYSDIEYRNYKKTVSSTGSDASAFKKANGAHKVSIIFGGIACVTYVYDFAWVVNKGIKNDKQSKELTNRLKNGPIKIIDAPIKPSGNE